jgi:hypothetical protein
LPDLAPSEWVHDSAGKLIRTGKPALRPGVIASSEVIEAN